MQQSTVRVTRQCWCRYSTSRWLTGEPPLQGGGGGIGAGLNQMDGTPARKSTCIYCDHHSDPMSCQHRKDNSVTQDGVMNEDRISIR